MGKIEERAEVIFEIQMVSRLEIFRVGRMGRGRSEEMHVRRVRK